MTAKEFIMQLFNNVFKGSFLFILLIIHSNISHAQQEVSQENKIIHPAITRAMNYYYSGQYDKAIQLFMLIDSSTADNYELKYLIGSSLLNNPYEKIKAKPYLEYAFEIGESKLPINLYKELGEAYQLSGEFNKAGYFYLQYKNKSKKSNEDVAAVDQLIENCNKAKILQNDTIDYKVTDIGSIINNVNLQFQPLIVADENEIIFSALDIRNTYATEGKMMFFKCRKIDDEWKSLYQFIFKEEITYKNISLAGISPDGLSIYFSIEKDGRTDLYYANISGYTIGRLTKFPSPINSKYNENSITILPDGSTMYFASDRPGGNGGYDLYITTLNKDDNWSTPKNIGKKINSTGNEIYPFIHPNNQILFFASNGHISIGGYDIFKAELFGDTWLEARNMGFPVNTPLDEKYFTVSADGETGYFSSNFFNKNENSDIYQVYLEKSIPLTMVKGTILAGDPLAPVQASIKVIDKSTNLPVKYVYNPNPETGKYLMIFPPNKNYDLIVEAKGYVPHLINIHIPNQEYFYELFQSIHLKPIRSIDKKVGEEIQVRNTFYDINPPDVEDENEIEKDYDPLFDLVENIINSTDKINGIDINKISDEISDTETSDLRAAKDYDDLFNMVDQAIETTDKETLDKLEKEAAYDNVSSQTFFYPAEGEESNLNAVIVGNDTIYTAPYGKDETEEEFTIQTSDTEEPTEEKSKQQNIFINYQIFYEINESDINEKYIKDLEDIARLIINHKSVGVEILGYADALGDEKTNLLLSEKRANKVLYFLQQKGCQPDKIIIKGLGESSREKNDSNNRRVNISVFQYIE